MRLPKAEHAIVDDSKIRDYLLSAEHPIGRFKAVVFTALGYTRDDWRRLRDDVLRIAAAGEATPGHPSEFGEKYEVPGVIEGRTGAGQGC